MKYASPKYENALIETKDIITSSVTSNKFEVKFENEEKNKGNVIMNALDIF